MQRCPQGGPLLRAHLITCAYQAMRAAIIARRAIPSLNASLSEIELPADAACGHHFQMLLFYVSIGWILPTTSDAQFDNHVARIIEDIERGFVPR